MSIEDFDQAYDTLIGLIYEGALEQKPWQSALPLLREMFDAQVVSLVYVVVKNLRILPN